MIVEAVHRPLRFHFVDGSEVHLIPGQPVRLDIDRALRLLAKAPGKVKAVRPAPCPFACWICRDRRYWLSVHDVLVCGTCHPPTHRSLVVEWLDGKERIDK